jgi:hypothetical protein
MPRDLVPGRVRPPARERRAPAARSSNGHCAAHDEDRRDPHGMWMVVVRSGGSSRRQATGTLFGVGSAPLLSFSPPSVSSTDSSAALLTYRLIPSLRTMMMPS